MICYFLVQQLIEPSGKLKKIPLNKDEIKIGRGIMRTSLSSYNKVSRKHAVLYRSDSGAIFLKDLNSSNGSYVNGVRIGTSLYQLNVGDVIGFGVSSVDDHNGFVCILKSEVSVKIDADTRPEVVENGIPDTDRRGMSNTSKNECEIQALNRTKATDNPVISTIQSCASLSNPSVNSNGDDTEVSSKVNNSFTLNEIKEVDSPEIILIESFTSDTSFPNKSDSLKHGGAFNEIKRNQTLETLKIQCDDDLKSNSLIANGNFAEAASNVTSSFTLNKIETVDSFAMPRINSCASSSSSSNKRDNFESCVEVEHNFSNSSASFQTSDITQIERSPVELNLKKVQILLQDCCTENFKYPNESDNSKSGVETEHDFTNSFASLQTSKFTEADCSPVELNLKDFQILLQDCYSEYFKCPAGVIIPSKKQKNEEERQKRDSLLHKTKKHIQQISDCSDSNNEENIPFKTSALSLNKKRKTSHKNSLTRLNDCFVSDNSSQEALRTSTVHSCASGSNYFIESDNFVQSALIKSNITSSFALNEIKTADSPKIPSVKSCAPDFISSSTCDNFKNDVDVKHNVMNSSASIQTSENAQKECPSVDLNLKNFHILLHDCCSENFKCPESIIPDKMQKNEDQSDKNYSLLGEIPTSDYLKTFLNSQNPVLFFSEQEVSFSSDESNRKSIHSKTSTCTKDKRKKNDPFISDGSEQEIVSDTNLPKKYANENCYSQNEEIIIISDDESYLDSQNYIPIKEESLHVQEDIDNVNKDYFYRNFFNNSEIESSISGIQECNSNVETIEDIEECVNSSVLKSRKKMSDTTLEINGLRIECDESGGESTLDNKEADSGSENSSADKNSQLQVLNSVQFPLGNDIDKNSFGSNQVYGMKNRVKNRVNSSLIKRKKINKSIEETLITDPKSLQLHPPKMHGREDSAEPKKHQCPTTPVLNKQPKRLNKLTKNSSKKTKKKRVSAIKIQISNANSGQKSYRIIQKLEVQNKNILLNKNQLSSVSNEASYTNSKKNVLKTKKVSTLKKVSMADALPENLRSGKGLLKEKFKEKSRKGNIGEKEKLDEPKEIYQTSTEKQNRLNTIPVVQKQNISDHVSVTVSNDIIKHGRLNHKSTNSILGNPHEVFVSLNSTEDTPEYLISNNQSINSHSVPNNQSISSVSKNFNQISDTLKSGVLNHVYKNPSWGDPSTSTAFNSLNKTSVPSTIYKDAPMHSSWGFPTTTPSQHLRSTPQSTSSVSWILNNRPVPLNSRDPRQVQTKSTFELVTDILNVDKMRAEQVPNISIPPLSSLNQTQNCKTPIQNKKNHFQINYLILAKKLINLKCVWLQEQAIYENHPPPDVKKDATMLPVYFSSYDWYASLFYPLMMLEIWNYMYTESKEVFHTDKAANKFYFSVLSYISKTDCIELKCESIVAEKVSYTPREGSMVMLQMKDSTLKVCQSVFGYIFKHSINKLNTNSLQNSKWLDFPNEWLTNAKHWTFYAYIKKKDMSFALGSLMKGNGICYIRSKLRLADALGQVKNSPLLQSIIKPNTETFSVNYPTSSEALRDYTSCQIKLINGIFSEIMMNSRTQSKIVLVQGPPGSGKTHAIIGLIEKLVLDCKKFTKILVVAPSNAAVDEIGCRLIDLNERNYGRGSQIVFVRVGSVKQIHKKILPYCLDKKAKELFKQNLTAEIKKRDKELYDLQKEIDRNSCISPSFETNEKLMHLKCKLKHLMEKKIIKEMDFYTEMSTKGTVLKECHVVLSTLNSCGSAILTSTFKPPSNIKFTCCIIDDSTQCTEIEALQPVMFGIDKLVLVGDTKQLPVSVSSKLACKYGFNRSMFERFRLFFVKNHCKTPIFSLTDQFRMHSEICKFASKHFYDGKLFADPLTDTRYSHYPINPYVVLDVTDCRESNNLSSKSNCYGTSVILNICKSLVDVIDLPSSIGIITLCQEQRSLYEKILMKDSNVSSIEINTVDGFQGREKEVIIMSCITTGSLTGRKDFLTCRTLLSAAITRAKKCLIICFDANSLKDNYDWKLLIKDAQDRNVLYNVTSPDDIPYLFKIYIKKVE